MAKIRYLGFDGLINAGTADFFRLDNELTTCKNCYCYKLNLLQKCPGYAKATTSQVIDNEDVNYLHHYYDSSAKVNYMLAGSDSTTAYAIDYRTTGNFAAINVGSTYDGKAGSQPCMVNYLDRVFIVGYKSSDKTFLTNATINGTTFATSDGTNLTNMPQGKYVVEYRDLLYVLHAYSGSVLYPSRVYFSGEPTAGAITWTVATDLFDCGQEDGDEITGGVEALDRLIIFKQYSMWKWDESSVLKIADIGCDSFRSIAKIGSIPYWFNRNGFWRYNGGDAPQLISSKFQPFIDAIDQTKLDEVVAAPYGFEYRAYIGDITVDDITYNNAWFCFNAIREKVYIRCTYDEVKSACTYYAVGGSEASKRRTYFGNDDGYVMKFAIPIDEVYSDNAQDIDSFFITNNIDSGDPSVVKESNHMTVFTKNAAGMKFAIDPDNSGNFTEDNKQITKNNVDEIDINTPAYRMRLKFMEKGQGKSWELEGFIISNSLKEQVL